MLRKLLLYQQKKEYIDFNIFEASYGGLDQAVEVMLINGADPNLTDENGWSPLMYAAYGGHAQTVRILLEAGADIHFEHQGATALWWAKEKGHLDVALLIDEGSGK